MFRHVLNAAQSADERKDLFGPVADLMVGVIFIFIILLIGLALNLQPPDLQKENDELHKENDRLKEFVRYVRDQQIGALLIRIASANETRTQMLKEMQLRLREFGIKVNIDPTNGTLKLPAGGLFMVSQADPTPEGRATIQRLGEVLAQVLPCYSQGINQSVRRSGCPDQDTYSTLSSTYVEGHTDVVPFGAPAGRFRDNWDLSAGRAIQTFNLLQEAQPLLRDLRNQDGDALLGVSGYAETRPATRATDRLQPSIRDLDRRIEVRLTMTANEAVVREKVDSLNLQLRKVDDLLR